MRIKIYQLDGEKDKNGVKFMIAHVLRFWDEYELLK